MQNLTALCRTQSTGWRNSMIMRSHLCSLEAQPPSRYPFSTALSVVGGAWLQSFFCHISPPIA
ncbi:hypothetical protein FOTG_19155 [Fusarium oxysporum f. sp. vasinfectum 25433]|uniref:Uncharacterized protein n=1 Tax=Fusarium oxysporum f. sp. vasinfectum 25433 TaxID=1089449 RepID=X0KFJ7_FUSOX|nr:hypothetical protein FOTG_19155 [Fusarium oxysporum f. sp. vasinfectum 25433]